jgi:predicted metal-dependent peptidase
MEDRIKAISEKWFIIEPLLFMTLMSHEITPNKGLRHLIRSGQGRIEYSFDYDPAKLSDAELEENLRAEVMRILLRHPYRHHGKKDTAYMASNITLNENYKFRFLKYKAGEIWKNKFNFLNQNFEFYYREILKMDGAEGGSDLTEKGKQSSSGGNQDQKSQNQQSQNDSENSNGSGEQSSPQNAESNNASKNANSHQNAQANENCTEVNVPTECSELWQEDDFMDEKIKELIEWAKSSMSWGTIPGDLVQTLIASLKPEIDYRKILSAFRSSVISSSKMLTRFKPSRRYGFEYMGKKNEFTTSLLIAVDVSGSVSDKEVRMFYSAINRFFKYGIKTIDVLQFDCDLKLPVLSMKKAEKTVKLLGRGGTDFQPVIDYFEKSTKKKYDGLIFFTDGYAESPQMLKRTIRKTLWICNDKKSYEHHKDWMEKCGKSCWIKEK